MARKGFKMESVSKKLVLIIVAIVVSVFLVFMFAFQGVQNKAISFEEQITTSQSEIEIQEKRRADLIPNLVDCVKQYDQHEYETLMAVVEARGVNSDDAVEEIQTMVAAVAEAYPQLQSSANYQQLMTELATTENLIANVRSNYNTWVNDYNSYVRHFPNKQILWVLGYDVIDFQKMTFDVSEDAPMNIFE